MTNPPRMMSNNHKNQSGMETKFCRLCFESGAQKRPCCNAFYCDHCYIKNEKCPNCNVQTKQEKLTGATYQLKIFSEHEECRVCLDPGLLRRCCGNYYCDNCFYKSPTCRSCGTIVASIKEEKRKRNNLFTLDRAYASSVCLGWLLTVFLVICILCFFAIIGAAEIQAPVGINTYKCYGFFRTCELELCIDMNMSVANNIEALPPLNTYKPCTLNSLAKLHESACIFDQNLYHQSNAELGYDICYNYFERSPGLFIFEDTFENWQNISFQSNLMKSAKWSKIQSAFPNSYCGAKKGKKSLSFRGENPRFAETKDFDLSLGGRVDGWMFMPPLSYDVDNPFCRTGYIGTVNLEYSINKGVNWTTIVAYNPAVYRSDEFFHISVDIPEAGWTNQTRIRFNQPVFSASYDNWALDDIRVLRFLPKDWRDSSSFISNLRKGMDMIQYAQCCADTDWCSRRLTETERNNCSNTFGWYNIKTYLFRLSEIIICVTLLVNLIKFFYISIVNYYLYHQLPFHDECLLLLNANFISHWINKLPIEYRIQFTLLLNQWNNGGPAAASSNKNNGNNYTVNETISQIHQSARLQEEQRNTLNDIEGEGVMLKSKEVIEEERKAYHAKLAKQKKKLAKRMKKKNFKLSTIVIEEDYEYLNQLESNILPVRDDNNNILYSPTRIERGSIGGNDEKEEGDEMSIVNNTRTFMNEEIKYDANQMTIIEDVLLDNKEKLRRQNMSMLRIPFEFDCDDSFRFYFMMITIFIFVLMFLIEFSITTDYTIYQPFDLFGIYTQTFTMNGFILIIFAAFCDFKEIYYIIKTTVPTMNSFLPYITVDLSEDNRSLYIGNHRIPLAQIKEINAFPIEFIHLHLAGICAGVFPYCLFSLLLREAFLDYSAMRFVTPLLGGIMIVRATLGPLFVIKAAYALQYIFAYHFNTREQIGKAMQKKSSLHIALNVSLGMTALGLFFCALTSMENLGFVAVAGIFGGAVYGLFTGTAHELSIKPWICKLLSSSSMIYYNMDCV